MLLTGRRNYAFESNMAYFKQMVHHQRGKLCEVVREAWEQMPGNRYAINPTMAISAAHWLERLP